MKFLQWPVKTVLFYPPPYYKSLQSKEEKDKQYWNEIAVKFLKQKYNKYNTNTTIWGFPIKMYIGGPPHKPYFIVLTLQEKIIIRPTKKMVILYVVGYLALLD